MSDNYDSSWAAEEFAEVNFGDKRLDARLIKILDRFSGAPESPINQACADWAETSEVIWPEKTMDLQGALACGEVGNDFRILPRGGS